MSQKDTRSALPNSPENEPSQAEEVFFQYLEEREQRRESVPSANLSEKGERDYFEQVCSQFPQLAVELRQLYEEWHSMQSMFNDSNMVLGFAENFQEKFGSMDESLFSIQDTPPEPESSKDSRQPQHLFGWADSSQRYYPIGKIGLGGMGIVMKVRDRVLRRHLAMKVIRSRRADGKPKLEDVKRLLEEAQITGQLKHPGIVPVHDLGLDGDHRPFFTMHHVEGEDFSTIISHTRKGEAGWNLGRALRILLKVCEAVAYAHSKNVIHRDLKPSNIRVGTFGETYVMDWGLAKVLDHQPQQTSKPEASAMESMIKTDRRSEQISPSGSAFQTEAGSVLGTPAYMPPEQAEGSLEEVEQRSDVYSLGAIIYHLLCGQAPYQKPNEKQSTRKHADAVLQRVRKGPPEPLDKLDPGAPPELVAICEKAMQRAPEERYSDMMALAEDLQAYLDGRIVSVYDATPLTILRKWIARNKALAAASAAVAIITLGSLLFFAVFQKINSLKLAVQNYVLNMIAAESAIRDEQTGKAKTLLYRAPIEQRDWVWNHLNSRTDSSLRTWADTTAAPFLGTVHSGPVREIAVDPQKRWVATCSWDGYVKLWPLTRDLHDLQAADMITILEPDQRDSIPDVPAQANWESPYILGLAFHPAGRWLAAGGYDGKIYLLDLNKVQASGSKSQTCLAEVIEAHEDHISELAFDRTGNWLASGSYDHTAKIWDVSEIPSNEKRTEIMQLLEHKDLVYAVDFHPHEDLALTASWDGQLVLWDLTQSADQPGFRNPLLQLENGATAESSHQDQIWAAYFSPDGSRIASISKDRCVSVWDVAQRRRLRTLKGHQSPLQTLDFHPDPTIPHLVSGGRDQRLKLWNYETGSELATLVGHHDWVWCTKFIPYQDTTYLLSGDTFGTVKSWHSQSFPQNSGRNSIQPIPQFGALDEEIYSMAWNPQHNLLAVGGRNGGVILLDPIKMQIVDYLNGHLTATRNTTFGVAFHPFKPWLISTGNDRSLRWWDINTGEQIGLASELLNLRTTLSERVEIAVHPHKDEVAIPSSPSGEVTIFDLESEQVAIRIQGHDAKVLLTAFSPDGRYLITGSIDKRVRIWNADTYEPVSHVVLEHPDRVLSLDMNADGSLLATGCHDARVRVWNFPSGTLKYELKGHTAWVSAVEFMDGENLLASGAIDESVRIWNLEHGNPVVALQGHENAVSSLKYDQARRALYSSSLDQTVRLWLTEEQSERTAYLAEMKNALVGVEQALQQFLPVDSSNLARQLEEVTKQPGISTEYKEEIRRRLRLEVHEPEYRRKLKSSQ